MTTNVIVHSDVSIKHFNRTVFIKLRPPHFPDFSWKSPAPSSPTAIHGGVVRCEKSMNWTYHRGDSNFINENDGDDNCNGNNKTATITRIQQTKSIREIYQISSILLIHNMAKMCAMTKCQQMQYRKKPSLFFPPIQLLCKPLL